MRKLLVVGSNTNHTYNYIALVRDAFDEVLLITDHPRDGFDFPIHKADFSIRSLGALLGTPRQIQSIVQSFQPTVIHIHQANSFAWYTLRGVRKMGIPTILTAWGSDVLLLPQQGKFLRRMVQYNLRHADVFTSDSTFMAEAMRKLVPERKLDILIANFGIDVDPVELPREKIVYSNRLHKKLYRIDEIVRAFARFKAGADREEWRLVIAATGEETPALETLVKELNLTECTEFAGWVNKEENARWYARAHFWVSIPASDATAISLLEAMASGCVPVVSDLPANREWIEHGENGWIASKLETDFIGEALAVQAESARATNKKLIAEDGTREANREKFLELYKKSVPSW